MALSSLWQRDVSLLRSVSLLAGVCTVEGVGQEQASEARESSGGPGRCSLQLLAFLPFSGVQMPPSLLCPCTGCSKIEGDGYFTFMVGKESCSPTRAAVFTDLQFPIPPSLFGCVNMDMA